MIKNYWANLNERERWLVGVGGVCLALYLFYTLLYSPLSSAVETKTNQLKEKQATLLWMQQVSQKPKPTKTPNPITNNRLLTLITTQLRSKPLQSFPYQLEQTGQGDIQLSFESVPYNLLLHWLWALQTEYTVSLKQLTAEGTATPGVVKLLILLSAE